LIFISQLELDGRSELFLSKVKREYEMSLNEPKDGEPKIQQIKGNGEIP